MAMPRSHIKHTTIAAFAAAAALAVGGTPASPAAAPCTIEWDGGAGTGDWADDANWTLDRQPSAADEVCVGPGADVRFGAANAQVAGLRLDGTLTVTFSELEVLGTGESDGAGTLTIRGGRLAVDGELRIATLRQSGGLVRGDGTLTSPDFSWTGGQQQGGGTTVVAAGGPGLALAGGLHTLDQTRTLRIDEGANASLTSGDVELDDHARIDNAGLLELRGDDDLIGCCGRAPEVVNEVTGTIRKAAGGGISQITYPFANDGRIEVRTGTLSLDGGSIPGRPSEGAFQIAADAQLVLPSGPNAFGAGSSFAGDGLLRVTGGITHIGGSADTRMTIDGPGAHVYVDSPIAVPQLTLARGFVDGSATLSTPDLEWTGGLQIGDGATRIVPGGSGLAVSGDEPHTLEARRLEIAEGATAAIRAGIAFEDGALLDNSGVLDIAGDDALGVLCCGAPPAVHNAGTLRKSGGEGRAQVLPELRNDGIVEARSGTLDLAGGLANLDQSGSLIGGRYVVTAALAVANAPVRTNVAAIVLDGPDSRIEDEAGGDALSTLESNVGELTLAGGRELATGGDLASSGAVTLGEAATLAPAGVYSQTDGVTAFEAGDATLAPGTRAELTAGVLRGSGTVAAVLRNAAEVAPGTGVLSVIGDYSQTGSGVLTATVAGLEEHSRLDVDGRTDLAGTLRIVTRDFDPEPSDEIELMRYADGSGEFDAVEGLEPAAGDRYSPPDYPDGGVWLRPGTEPSVSIGDATAAERGAATLTVTADPVPTRSVRVTWHTLDGTATAPADYAASSGTATIPHGRSSTELSVPIAEDAVDEPDETFGVELTGATAATLGRAAGLVAILDDDPPAVRRPPPHKPPRGGGRPPHRPPTGPPVRWPHPQPPISCVDHRRPTSRLLRGHRGVRRHHRRLRLRGRARDRGCSHLRRVQVSIALHRHHRCRFVKKNGRLTGRTRCRHARWITVHGRRSWHLRTKRLRPGRYTIRTRAVDRAGNLERKRRRARPRRVRVR
ncbi:MAG: Calx-beta domain-containing protein [Thermoleophilaceae bacterium]